MSAELFGQKYWAGMAVSAGGWAVILFLYYAIQAGWKKAVGGLIVGLTIPFLMQVGLLLYGIAMLGGLVTYEVLRVIAG